MPRVYADHEYKTDRRPRDSQRSKVYKAEKVLQDHQTSTKFNDLRECEKYINKIIHKSRWFRKNWLVTKINTEPGRGHRRATASRYLGDYGRGVYGTIQLPKWARHKAVILHELAHIITPNHQAAHGWMFANNFLLLVRHFMGREAADLLMASYKKHKVKYKPPRKISEARRQQLREHMNKVRKQHGQSIHKGKRLKED